MPSLFAADAPVVYETEQGTLSGSARIVNDTTASGGKAVVFGASTNVSPTPPSPAPPSQNTTGRSFVHGKFANLNDITHTFGTFRTDGVNVPNWRGHINMGGGIIAKETASRKGSAVYQQAMARWNQNSANRPKAQTDIGIRSLLTFKMSHQGHPKRSPQPSNSELAILDMARHGSTGSDNYNEKLKNIGKNLAEWPGDVFFGLSHESNGSWYSNYSGVNTNLVGNNTLKNIPDSRFGREMGVALRAVANKGDMAKVHKLAFEHASKQIRDGAASVNSKHRVWIVYTLTGSSDSRPPGDVPNRSFSSEWSEGAHPAPQYFDVLGITLYGRGNGRPTYKGSGDVNNTANWRFPNSGLESTYYKKAQEWNRPLGFWELGLNWDVFDWDPTYSEGPTDQQGYIWWKKNFEDLPKMDLAFIAYWHAGGDRVAGSTYQLPEANYGRGKTSGTNPKFPKTLNILRENF